MAASFPFSFAHEDGETLAFSFPAEELLRLGVASMRHGFCVLDHSAAIVFANPAAQVILGVQRGDLLGHTITDIFWRMLTESGSELPGKMHPGFLALKTGQHQLPTVVGFYRPDGDLIWLLVDCAPLKGDADPRPSAAVLTFSEITDQKRSEHATEQREDYFRTLIENISDIITVLDEDGKICFESASVFKVLGYKPKELIGRNAFDFVHPDDRDTVTAAFQFRLAHPEEPQATRYRMQHKNGAWKTIESVSALQRNDIGRLRIVITSRDLSDRL